MRKELRVGREAIYTEMPPFPHNMMIEPTNACNHRCAFCGFQKMKRVKARCDKAFMFDIMKQAYANGTREVGFYLIGEPLLNPELEDYVAYARNLGFEYIYLTTNGALATKERMERLIRAGLNSVKFSINAGTPATYKRIHGKDDYEIVRNNVKQLRRYVMENRLELAMFISFVKTKITVNETEQFQRDFEQYVDKIYFYDCANQGGYMLETLEKDLVREGELTSGTVPCDMVFNRLHVTCEGYLDACCADVDGMLAAVDLHEMSLRDAWYSDTMVGLRRRFLQNRLEGLVCFSCINNASARAYPLNSALYQATKTK